MEKINEDPDSHLKLFENRMNSTLFKFLVREYYSNSMNPFLILKMLSKILFSQISKLLKLKYISFFLTVLRRLTVNSAIFKEHINPIITDTLEHILTRKADYVIILQYAIFLVQIGQLDFALSRLQIFSTDIRFINNGELVFYRGLIDYMGGSQNYLPYFQKSLTLLKKNDKSVAQFIIEFLMSKNKFVEAVEILKHDKIKEIYLKNDKKRLVLFNIITELEYMENNKKISIILEEMDKSFTDIFLARKLNNICEDGVCQHLWGMGANFLIYLKFLYGYIVFDYNNEECLKYLYELLNFLESLELNSIKMEIDDSSDINYSEILQLVNENNKILVRIVLKSKILKSLIKSYSKLDQEYNYHPIKFIYLHNLFCGKYNLTNYNHKLNQEIENNREICYLIKFIQSI